MQEGLVEQIAAEEKSPPAVALVADFGRGVRQVEPFPGNVPSCTASSPPRLSVYENVTIPRNFAVGSKRSFVRTFIASRKS